jgi:hypothetical protein
MPFRAAYGENDFVSGLVERAQNVSSLEFPGNLKV